MNSKIHEDLFVGECIESADYRSAGSLYNGAAAASDTYIDTTGCDSILFVANVGVIGAGNTLDLNVLENDEDSVDAAEAISGAAFTQLTPSNDQTVHYAELKCDHQKKYLWLESFKAGTGSCNIGVTYLMNGGIRPVMSDPAFDVDGAPSI
jgi:hypothetical protein